MQPKRTPRTILALALTATLTLPISAAGKPESPSQSEQTPITIEEGNLIERETPPDSPSPQGDPLWLLARHPKDNQIVNDISTIIQRGYTPVGMDHTHEEISVLYAKTAEITFDRWMIQEFTDLSDLDTQFSQFLLTGWAPMDISLTETGLAVLFVQNQSEEEITGWRIHKIDTADPQPIFETLQGYRDDRFIPYGITLDHQNGELWVLFLQFEPPENATIPRMALNAFPNGSLQEDITNDVRNGMLPWGLAHGRESSFILYLF